MRDGFLHQSIRFFRLRGSQEKAARGFAIGVACNFYPTFGFGGFLAVFLARIFGGDMVAGFLGGASLCLFWPVLFYLNIRVGGLFLRPALEIDDLGDVTERTVSALVWGKTFLIGSVLNSFAAGVVSYLVFLLVYEQARPGALRWLRGRVRSRRPA